VALTAACSFRSSIFFYFLKRKGLPNMPAKREKLYEYKTTREEGHADRVLLIVIR
jgi:hypothetical protein